MIYEWDEAKRASNLKKHGLDFAAAWRVFEAPAKVTVPESRPEAREPRWADLAEVGGRILLLAYTFRGESVRCISFRPAKRKERSFYHAEIEDRPPHD